MVKVERKGQLLAGNRQDRITAGFGDRGCNNPIQQGQLSGPSQVLFLRSSALIDLRRQLPIDLSQLPGSIQHPRLQVGLCLLEQRFSLFTLFDLLFKLQVLRNHLALQVVYGQVGLDPRQDFVVVKGLGDIVHPANFEPLDLSGGLRQSADENHRNFPAGPVRLYPAADLVAVHIRHVDIQ